MQVVTGLSVQLMDTLDERQGLGGERQDMSAAIIRIRYALDEAAASSRSSRRTSVIGLMSRI